ncbi:hypothetical protein RND71_005364 [Anisodus tanguticus]|uniref:Uncharacterized protein n=1 Tax=Anisodus tanguticus TaxID=243964 RepID=A0AAE1SSU1_9SOLA|nr:hypothetical protein RND71_005364 [Anisodus tanguticus]
MKLYVAVFDLGMGLGLNHLNNKLNMHLSKLMKNLLGGCRTGMAKVTNAYDLPARWVKDFVCNIKERT